MHSSTETLDLLSFSTPPSHKVGHSHQTTCSVMKVFDLDDPEDDTRLKQWCRVHWSATIKKSMDSYNSVTYHDCCFSFSRRGYTRRWDHPELESTPISKIPTLKSVS